MYHLTIQDALTGNIETSNHCLYVYCDHELVLYIGRSVFPLERLREHLGWGTISSRRSPLGDLIVKHLPCSLSWTVDLFTVVECKEFVYRYRPEYQEWYQQQLEKRLAREASEVAEEALIEHYQPCLNAMGNRRGKPLPRHYEAREIISILSKEEDR